MQLDAFSKLAQLNTATELEKVRLLAYYFHKTFNIREFDLKAVASWFQDLHFHTPNIYRLKKNLDNSNSFIRGSQSGFWKLHAIDLDELQENFPGLRSNSEEINSLDTILPTSLYQDTRGFIESLSKQINASFEYNIFDGCAVLMRRLIEVLLILSYENLDIESEIKDSNGNYFSLEQVITKAKSNQKLKLSRDAKSAIDEFRTIGNFSAHKIYFNCKRADLQKIATNYRATIEELLYKSGIKK